MRWFWQKKQEPVDRDQALEEVRDALRKEGKSEKEIARMEKLSNVLHIDDPELADANLIVATAAEIDDEFKTIMAQASNYPSSTNRDPWLHPSHKGAPAWTKECRAVLYTQDGKPANPFFCDLPRNHEGKHGKPNVPYLHPKEHPLMVNVRVEDGHEITTIRESGEVHVTTRKL